MFDRFAYLLVVLFVLAVPARAQQIEDIVDMRLLPGWRLAGGDHMAALEITLRDGWKTYWRAPGDAGIPPEFDWRRSQNLDGVEVIWPTPGLIDQGGVQTIGYKSHVVLPLRVRLERSGRAVALDGTVEMGVCSDVCVPVTLRVSETLTAGGTRPDPRIAAALADRPYSAAEADVSHVACKLSPAEDGLVLRAEIDMPARRGSETAIVEVDTPGVWVARPRTARSGGRLVAETRLYHVEGRAFAVNRSGIRITVLSGGQAVDIQGCPAG